MRICIWNDIEYQPFYNEVCSWADVTQIVDEKVDIILILQSKDIDLERFVSIAVKTNKSIISSPTMDFDIMNRIFTLTKHRKGKFYFLDYKSFDNSIRSFCTNGFVTHIDIKTFYPDGPPVRHEIFYNMAMARSIMGAKQFVYRDTNASITQLRDISILTTLRIGLTTVCLYTGRYMHGNIDSIFVYGHHDNSEYIHEMGNPFDTRSYYERYGASIKNFIENVNMLDQKWHDDQTKMVMSKFKTRN
jgi:hypothetical protein